MILTTIAIAVLASIPSSETLAIQLKTFGIPTVAFLMRTLRHILKILAQILFSIDYQNIMVFNLRSQNLFY
jgi:hypothetical protein